MKSRTVTIIFFTGLALSIIGLEGYRCSGYISSFFFWVSIIGASILGVSGLSSGLVYLK
jgi:hypothetical protein